MAERWWAYFVACADGSLYAGCTNNLKRRVEAHNQGRGARYTRSRRPVKLVWSRGVLGKGPALSLEAKLKRLSRDEKLALVKPATRAKHRGTAAMKARVGARPKRRAD